MCKMIIFAFYNTESPKMKYLHLIALLFLLASCESIFLPDNKDFNDSITTLGTSYIYDINSIPEITLEVTTSEWKKLLSDFDMNKYNEEYVKSDFNFLKDGKKISLSDVGIHIRGNSSRRRPEGDTGEVHNPTKPVLHQASFAINFKKFVKGQRLAGAEKVNLKWFKDDASYVREIYCYDLFERFGVWTTPAVQPIVGLVSKLKKMSLLLIMGFMK